MQILEAYARVDEARNMMKEILKTKEDGDHKDKMTTKKQRERLEP